MSTADWMDLNRTLMRSAELTAHPARVASSATLPGHAATASRLNAWPASAFTPRGS